MENNNQMTEVYGKYLKMYIDGDMNNFRKFVIEKNLSQVEKLLFQTRLDFRKKMNSLKVKNTSLSDLLIF
jgi:hypothetical protein